jgi:hypothetical protein
MAFSSYKVERAHHYASFYWTGSSNSFTPHIIVNTAKTGTSCVTYSHFIHNIDQICYTAIGRFSGIRQGHFLHTELDVLYRHDSTNTDLLSWLHRSPGECEIGTNHERFFQNLPVFLTLTKGGEVNTNRMRHVQKKHVEHGWGKYRHKYILTYSRAANLPS